MASIEPESDPARPSGDDAGPIPVPARRPTGLAGRLYDRPFSFDFFQAVRLLQRIDPTRVAVGRGGPPSAEAVRFRSRVSLAFPPSAIHDVLPPEAEGSPPVMVEAFFGLIGPNGPLPRHYTELLFRLDRDSRDRDRHALRDWFDLFNHRLVSLFYRSWEKYRFYAAYDREAADRPEGSPYGRALLSLSGLGLPAVQGRMKVRTPDRPGPAARLDDRTVLYYAGLFARRPRNASSLAAMAGDYLRVPAEVRQFRGQWFRLERANQTALVGSGPGQRLGVSAVVGERVYNVRSKFRLRLGPLGYRAFLGLLPDPGPDPDRKGFFLLSQLVRLYVGPGLDFDVQLVLKAEEVPEYRLGDDTSIGPRLGWNLWLRSLPMGADPEDAVFESVESTEVGDRPTGPDRATRPGHLGPASI